MLYNGPPLSPSKLPLRMGDLNLYLIHGFLVQPELHHHRLFLHGSRGRDRNNEYIDQQTTKPRE